MPWGLGRISISHPCVLRLETTRTTGKNDLKGQVLPDMSYCISDTMSISPRYTNNWCNRLVGDCFLPPEKRVTRSVLHYLEHSQDAKRAWKSVDGQANRLFRLFGVRSAAAFRSARTGDICGQLISWIGWGTPQNARFTGLSAISTL